MGVAQEVERLIPVSWPPVSRPESSMALAWLVVTAFAAVACYFFGTSRWARQPPKAGGTKPFREMPGPPGRFLIGNTAELASDSRKIPRLFSTYTRWALEHGDEGLYRYQLFSPQGGIIHYVNVVDPDLIAQVQGLPKSPIYGIFRQLFGAGAADSMFTALHNDQQWRNSRKTMAHSFSTDALKTRFPAIIEKSQLLAEKIAKFGPHHPIACENAMSRAMLDMLLATGGFGIEVNALSFERCELLDELAWCFEEASRQVARPWHAFAVRNLPWLQVAKSYALHHGRLYRQWALICQNMRSQPPPTSDDVSIAAALRRIKSAKTGLPLAGDELQAEVATMVVGATDTSANTLSFTLTSIAYHPHVQLRIIQELQDAGLASADGTSPRELTYTDLATLKYLEAVLKEAMRLFPVAFGGTKRAVAEPMVLRGYTIPAGVMISTPTYTMQRLPQNFPEPGKFNPERWLDTGKGAGNKHAYIPFSYGARDCPGQRLAMMQMMAVLAVICGRFHLKPGKGMGTWESLEERLMGKFALGMLGDSHLHFIPHAADGSASC